MKKKTKRLLVVAAAFIAAAAITVCADILVQYRQNYAAAPYVNTDPAVSLTADALLFETPDDDVTPERAPYLLGWLRDEDIVLMQEHFYFESGTQAKDARTDAEAALIGNAGYHIFTTDENTAFDALLRKMRFRPLNGFQNIRMHRKVSASNFVASFRLRSFYVSSEYSDTPGYMSLGNEKMLRGEIFTAGRHTYLAGCFAVGSYLNESTGLYEPNPAVTDSRGPMTANNMQYSLFEIEPSAALDELLRQKETFAGGKNERISRYVPYYPARSAKTALTVEFAALLLALLLLFTRRKKTAVRLLALLAAFAVTVGSTLALTLAGEYKGLFRPSVYTNAKDPLTFADLFSDISQTKLASYDEKTVVVSHRLQFAGDGTSYTPEEFTEQTAQIYARPDWRKYHFSKADVEEFAGLLRQLTYRPVGGVKNIWLASQITDKNAFGYFVRDDLNELEAYYFEDEPCWPCVIWEGQFFTVGGRTYLLAWFRTDRELGAALSARYRQKDAVNRSFSVFEIEPSAARTRLLEKQADFRGEPAENRDNAYYRWFPADWLKGEAAVFALTALAVLIDQRRRKYMPQT